MNLAEADGETAFRCQPLFSFDGGGAADAIDKWERIDDVIMGGVSNSRLVASQTEDCAYFEGRLRELGGGFCGQRMKLLSEPLDLSSQDGVYLDCEADADAPQRSFKMALRTRQDRGEVVYQAMFAPPPLNRSIIYLPFSDFRLVSGPRLVPGAPPLSADAAKEIFQISIVISKFAISETGASISNFKEGPFRLKLFSIGTFAMDAAPATSIAVPSPMTSEERAAALPLVLKLLGPLLGSLFGEERRRRSAAIALLKARGINRLGRWRYAWALRRAGGRVSLPKAAVRTLAVGLKDAAALALSLPVRLLAKIIFSALRLIRNLRGKKPGMPPLQAASD